MGDALSRVVGTHTARFSFTFPNPGLNPGQLVGPAFKIAYSIRPPSPSLESP
jgi:hypothetical protein